MIKSKADSMDNCYDKRISNLENIVMNLSQEKSKNDITSSKI